MAASVHSGRQGNNFRTGVTARKKLNHFKKTFWSPPSDQAIESVRDLPGPPGFALMRWRTIEGLAFATSFVVSLWH
jgi:hypothetical protein